MTLATLLGAFIGGLGGLFLSEWWMGRRRRHKMLQKGRNN